MHFVLIGGLLYAGNGRLGGGWRGHSRSGNPEPIIIREERIERMRADLASRTGAEPTATEKRILIEAAIDEELLYREAIALGLDRNDRSIRHYLAEKVRFLLGDAAPGDEAALARQAIDWGLDTSDLVVRRMLVDKMRLLVSRSAGDEEPSEADLEASLERHADRYRKPPRVSLTHVFFNARDEAQARARAREARRRLESGAHPGNEAAKLGDPFPLGARFRAKTETDLAKLFGASFAARVMQLETGIWSEGIPSAQGVHLVRVDEKRPTTLPPLSEVRSSVVLAFEGERRARRLRNFLDRLRAGTAAVVAAERANRSTEPGGAS